MNRLASNLQVTPSDHASSMQVDAIQALMHEIPLNDFGMPTGIYRTDLLPFHDYDPTPQRPADTQRVVEFAEAGSDAFADVGEVDDGDGIGVGDGLDLERAEGDPTSLATTYRIAGFPAEDLHQAFVPLQYDEGFPAFRSGIPFWGRLEYEPTDAFQAFQRYLQMSSGKAPAEMDDPEDEYTGEAANGSRSLAQLATSLHTSNTKALSMIEQFEEYYHLYYWNMRAHAYDLCRVAQHRARQELRSVETLDDQYIIARRLRHKVESWMEKNEDFWDLMTPKTAIDMHKHAAGLERISAGMPLSGPQSEQSGGKSLEIQLQTVANSNRRTQEKSVNDEDAILDRALEDPESTEILQRMIIKASG